MYEKVFAADFGLKMEEAANHAEDQRRHGRTTTKRKASGELDARTIHTSIECLKKVLMQISQKMERYIKETDLRK